MIYAPDPEASSKVLRSLGIACGLAILFWITALIARSDGRVQVWTDQFAFTLRPTGFFDPYGHPNFGLFNPPWATIFLIPFKYIPLEAATLIQAVLYFCILALIVHKYGGDWRAVAVALSTPFALDAVVELNIDWIVCLAVLVPPAYSFPLLAVKPQTLPGYALTLDYRTFVRALLVFFIVVLASFVVWGVDWPLRAYHIYGSRYIIWWNSVAPLRFLPWWVSGAAGVALLFVAFRRADPVLKMLAPFFFVPYLPIYTALVPVTLLTIRFPRAMGFVSLTLWILAIVAVRARLAAVA